MVHTYRRRDLPGFGVVGYGMRSKRGEPSIGAEKVVLVGQSMGGAIATVLSRMK